MSIFFLNLCKSIDILIFSSIIHIKSLLLLNLRIIISENEKKEGGAGLPDEKVLTDRDVLWKSARKLKIYGYRCA